MGASKERLIDMGCGRTIPCPNCGEEMMEDPQRDMTEGQFADYEAGHNVPFTCSECGHNKLYETDSIFNSYPDEEYFKYIPTEYYANAMGVLNEIQVLLCDNFLEDSSEKITALDLSQKQLDLSSKHLLKLLYGSSVTALESYLADAFKYNILNDEKYLKKFVDTYKPFQNEKRVTLPSILSSSDFAKDTIKDYVSKIVLSELNGIIFHKLNKVRVMYGCVYGIKFPDDWEKMFEHIQIRHDIYHRNGKDIEGYELELTIDDVTQVIMDVIRFIEDIEDKLKTVLKS